MGLLHTRTESHLNMALPASTKHKGDLTTIYEMIDSDFEQAAYRFHLCFRDVETREGCVQEQTSQKGWGVPEVVSYNNNMNGALISFSNNAGGNAKIAVGEAARLIQL